MSNKVEYKPLTIPQLRWNSKLLSDLYGELVAQPLEPGFGMTLGNSLRRVLLGAIEGSSVTSVIIKGVNNEFSSIPGVVQDTMQIILNIKDIVIKNKEGKAGKMHLHFKGEGVAKVSDIKADDHLELINKDHIIANVSDGELDIEFFVESGRGYQRAQWPADKVLQKDNRIYLDAMFSPVKKVYFDVEKTRVGEAIDYDKLILKIYTDGSENPKDVLHYSVSVLRTQFEHFLSVPEIPFNEFSKVEIITKKNEGVETKPVDLGTVSVEFLLKPIDELELSARAHNCLLSAGKKRVIDIVNLTEDEALKLKNFGRKSLREVKDSMKAFGLSFGMNISETDLKKD
ncbi:DNA-directed RNA polymerase subunit alpha [candidate division TM6 bacterium RIFCSPHIGHO2_12_FULL_32_22]|nr:MAG: DNA-directed RNA polymerase subunit alpha [candidate division TM6 bacterium RIFCSPHIGHO2_12_FULL_32_22]